MKAVSVRQPWAWAIVAGHKPIENRGRRTHHRGPLLIHASKKYDRSGHHFIEDALGIQVPDDLPSGGIIGQADLVDVVDGSISRWFFGPFGWVLANPRRLPFIEVRGQLGLFEVPDHIIAEPGRLGITEGEGQ